MKPLRNIINQAENALDKAKTKVKEELQLFDPVIIYPYMGYGTADKAYLTGRILEKEDVIHSKSEMENGFWHNLHRLWKRYESDEIPGVSIKGNFQGVESKTISNDEGYFTLEFDNLEEKQLENGWYEVELEITNMPFDLEYEPQTTGEIMINRQNGHFGIISDVDDTIIESNAVSFIKKLKTMLSETAKTRLAFEGVDELYTKLIDDYNNPLFFVSGSSFNLYDMLTKFCEYKNIPKAPFFLRDLGLDAKQWIKQDTAPYKKEYIHEILSTYDQLDFICIGDSGQQDPEIYREIYQKYPGRIRAIYIRHVHTQKRKEELEQMAQELDIPLLIMEHSRDALQHAKEMGWVNAMR